MSTDALVQDMDAAVGEAVKALAADAEILRLFVQYAPLHRFFSVRLFYDALQDLLVTLRAYGKDRLFFTVCYDCKALSEKGFTTLLQTLKITSAAIWRDVHEIKFPLPTGGHVDVSNEFVIPLTLRVLKKTVQTCHAVTQFLTERTVFLMGAEHKNHLSSDPDGHVFATVNTLGWEMWKFEEVSEGTKLFYVSSIEHDRALSCSSEGRIFTTQNRLGWEQWHLEKEDQGNIARIKSAEHGRYLSCDGEGRISASEQQGSWERWRLILVASHARELDAAQQKKPSA